MELGSLKLGGIRSLSWDCVGAFYGVSKGKVWKLARFEPKLDRGAGRL